MINTVLKQNEHIFDLDKAAQRLGGQTKLLQKLALLFLRDTPAQLKQIIAGIEAEDYEMCFVPAHSLKGTCSVFCNSEFECHCSEVTKQIAERNWQQAMILATQIRDEYTDFETQLKSFVMSYKVSD